MSLLIIRGPLPLPREVLAQLMAAASGAGRVLSVRACGSEQELRNVLRMVHGSGVEALVLDVGTTGVTRWFQRVPAPLHLPYVCVDTGSLPAHVDGRRSVDEWAYVQGYGMQGYVLALYLLLEHLGCAASCERFHIGT